MLPIVTVLQPQIELAISKATSLTTASGMLFITLSVTYILDILSAVTQKRSLASSIHGLGAQSAEILETGWDGDTFQGLEVPINMIANQLDTLTSNPRRSPHLSPISNAYVTTGSRQSQTRTFRTR